jgi:class 3 adenylate cyclase/predicted ATPase
LEAATAEKAPAAESDFRDALQHHEEDDLVDCPQCGSANPEAKRFCGDCGAALASPARAVDPAAGSGAERRQLTLMFCDIVGSTALSVMLDPEDLREIMAGYHRCCTEIIGRFHGTIARFMGDGVLAYFGYPLAHEDDAECSVRAALALIEEARGLGAGRARIEVRIGIATGLVVVGDLIGEGSARERSVVGQTPNLAARLQALAEPGTAVISAGTRQLVGGLFEYTDLGTHALKGFATPVQAWQVVGESAAKSRFEALRAAAMSPLVGRESERALLFERWEKAKAGAGQVVVLAGEAGLGKSRLAQAVSDALAALEIPRLHYYCSSFHRNSALYPVLEQLKRAAEFAADDGAETKLRKLESLMDRFGHGRDNIALLAHLVSIPGGERYPPPTLDRQAQKEAILSVMSGLLIRLAQRGPVLVVAEDLHWSDPSSLELLALLVKLVAELPVLMIATHRPEIALDWQGEHVEALTVERLNRQQSRDLLRRLTGDKPLPAEILAKMIERTDGIPLFIEEMTKAVMESGVLEDAGDHYELARSAPASTIPATLRDSLMARLDRLAEVKSVAQAGAAIGRTFTYELMAAISPLPEASLQSALDRLAASGLVFAKGEPPRAHYTFKHALVQETAYESLLRGRRQEIHLSIARALGERFPDVKATQPELLAHHYTLAGEADPAIEHWLQAGQRATERSAELEAIGHLSKALEVLETLPQSQERDRHELGIRIALLTPTIALRGYASPETAEAAAKAREVADRAGGDAGQLFPIMYGEWTSNTVRGRIPAARNLAEQYMRLARRQSDSGPLVVGHRMLGVSLWALGDLARGCEELERTIALYDPKLHASSAFQYAHDSRVSSLSHLSVARVIAGDIQRGYGAADEACRLAHELKHANTLGVALHIAGAMLGDLSGDISRVRHFSALSVRLAEEHGLALWLAAGRIYEAWLMADSADPKDTIAGMTAAIDRLTAIGVRFTLPRFLALLAELQLSAGLPSHGRDTLATAIATIEETGERIWESDLYRIKGKVLLACGGVSAEADANAAFEHAITVARVQGARFWELRATTALARLRQRRGDGASMRSRLAAIYGHFAGDAGLADVAAAKLTLDAIDASPDLTADALARSTVVSSPEAAMQGAKPKQLM